MQAPTALSPVTRPARTRHPRGYSKSQLEPILRAEGTLERQPGIRRRGRPRIVATWFRRVADAMQDGTPLKTALKLNGMTLEPRQIRALYRNRQFRQICQQTRCKRHKDKTT
jgi:hypothetical protein